MPNGSYIFAYFLWILSIIKMKFGEILVYLKTNMSKMFLAQCWRLGTSSRSCYNFNEITIWWSLSIFSSWHYPFLIIRFVNFQKIETLETWNNWLLSNRSRFLHLNLFKIFQKNISHFYICQLTKFWGLISFGSKYKFKNTSSLMY